MSSAAIDAAIFSALSNDATLTTLAPGGVFRGTSPQGALQPFVIVEIVDHIDELQMGASTTAFESVRYMVKAVDGSTSMLAAQSAADRIYAILNGAALSVSGYHSMLCVREERVAYTEVDDSSDHRFQHSGGMYRVMVDA
jgi:hypothetical protein